jgi:hypothetical protein
MLEVYKLTHLGQKVGFSLSKLARKQNGSILGGKTNDFYNIVNVVLASTIGVMPEAISFIWLMLH